MTRELHTCLTYQSAKFLAGALGHLDRDMYDRHSKEPQGLDAMRIAVDWVANDNETRVGMFTRGKEKREAQIALMDKQFAEILSELGGRRTSISYVEPLEWDKYFSAPLPNTRPAAPYPDDKIVPEGSLENCFMWSDHNLNRIGQHGFTLSICETLARDNSMLAHLIAPLAEARTWAWQRARDLQNLRTQLIVLEGDPLKIQALREEMADSVRRQNVSTSHFYEGINGQRMGSTKSENRFRQAVLHNVQAGFEPGNPVGSFDLGLG